MRSSTRSTCRLTAVARLGVPIGCWIMSLSIIPQVVGGIWTEHVLTRCWRAKRQIQASHHMLAPNSLSPNRPATDDGGSRYKAKTEMTFLSKPTLLSMRRAGEPSLPNSKVSEKYFSISCSEYLYFSC